MPRSAVTSVHADCLAGFPAEDRLLFECARGEIDAAGAKRVARILASRLDWAAVLEASVKHGVAPLLKRGLDVIAETEDVFVPPHIEGALSSLHASSGRRNDRLFEALREVVAAMHAVGVDPVGLKDIQLAAEVYSEPALRPMGDIDLMIRRDDWDAAAAALQELGFTAKPSGDVPYMRAYAAAQHFRRASDEIWVDLQWNVLQREWDLNGEGSFTYDGLGMWQRATAMTLDRLELRVPKLEDMLFHLCVHLEGHMYAELVLFCDIAELLRAKGAQLDWDEFLAITREYRSESSVYYVLWLTERLLGADVPAEVYAELKPAYFQANLFAPLFGNLTSLHHALDEMRLAAAPPRSLMSEMECVVRRQVGRALRLQRELDEIALKFRARGGTLIVFDGAPSPRLFPDPSLPAFKPLHVYVSAEDGALIEQVVGGQRRLSVTTRDEALRDEQFGLELVPERASSLQAASPCDEEGLTNARAALRSLYDRIVGALPDDRECVVRVIIHVCNADELLVQMAMRAGAASESRLFRLCGLLEVFRGANVRLDPVQVRQLARGMDVEERAWAALGMAFGLVDGAMPSCGDGERGTPPLVLEWARYGPSSLRRYPWLRNGYYFLFALLATPSWRERVRYVRSRLSGRTETGSPRLVTLVRGVVTGAVCSRREQIPPIQQLAHWLEPDAVAVLERLPQPAGRNAR